MVNNNLLFRNLTEKIANTDFSGYTIQYPPLFTWGERFCDKFILKKWSDSLRRYPDHLGLYVHIPYCKQKCSYCRYFSIELQKNEEIDTYLYLLEREFSFYQKIFERFRFSSLYIGGGTPSLLTVKQLEKLFNILGRYFNISHCKQIIIEGNPDFLDREKLILLKKKGVNRLTIGVQTLDPAVINAVNRYQTPNAFFRCFEEAKNAGIKDINVDLMVGLPGQDERSVVDTVKKVVSLRPEMVHVHPFYPTKLTSFITKGESFSENSMQMRDNLCDIAHSLIDSNGYKNIRFDAKGRNETSRNIQLSDAIEYNSSFLGVGSGAVSHARNSLRYVNNSNLNKYALALNKSKLPISLSCNLTKKDEMVYFLTACLRYGYVDKGKFKKMFNKDLEIVFSRQLRYLEKMGKISNKKRRLFSLMNNMGEYSIYSKYFYDSTLIRNYKNNSYHPSRIKSYDFRSVYL